MARLPDLLIETTPAPARIHTEAEYDMIRRRFGALMGRQKLTKAENKLMELLGVLVQDYDARHAMPPDDSTSGEMLQFIMEQSGRRLADLVHVFGQVSHASEAINGKRPISADQARKLGKMFSVQPGLFIR